MYAFWMGLALCTINKYTPEICLHITKKLNTMHFEVLLVMHCDILHDVLHVV